MCVCVCVESSQKGGLIGFEGAEGGGRRECRKRKLFTYIISKTYSQSIHVFPMEYINN